MPPHPACLTAGGDALPGDHEMKKLLLLSIDYTTIEQVVFWG